MPAAAPPACGAQATCRAYDRVAAERGSPHGTQRILLGRPTVIDGALWRDIRHAARVARMNAGFSSMVALTIAVGIGSTLTTFSAVDRLLLRGPDLVTQPDRVARLCVTTRAPGRPERTSSTVGCAVYTALRDN